ncbi:FG-GAP repeat domain-containing protein [Streptomyces sp. NBC_01013]|uniref:FG-GAP repeat domain-containing protein n=1 Tax=Streptomyces sp. NBC_01013 TaxID=2903718 RepID=UPI00386879FA|nr:VCBS repeat-containing protein [Streptomyces sp. NBC_01013]
MTAFVRGRAAWLGSVVGVTVLATTVVPAEAAPVAAPAVVATTGTYGLDFSGGRLNTVEQSPSGDRVVYERQVSADGVTVGERQSRGYVGPFANGAHLRSVPCDMGACVELVGAGNGSFGVVFVDGEGDNAGLESMNYRMSGTSHYGGPLYPAGTTKIVDLTGRSWVANGGSTAEQQAGVHPSYRATADPVVRKPTAASVWGTTLWAATSTTGALTATDLGQRKVVQTLATGAPCVIKEVRTVGRWIYWNCGTTGAAGVYDRTANKSFTVPSGPALVGDGYLVRHDRTAGKLLLTDFHTGKAAAPRAVADLPAGKTADQRRLTWAVDKFGGDIAYLDAARSIHIVPSGVPAQPLAKLASDVAEPYIDIKGMYGPEAWLSTWQFNKPVTWTYTVKDVTGRTVRTLKGGSGTETGVEWDGRTDTGKFAVNSRHTWTLRATAEDGSGMYTTSGSITVSGGTAGFHDQGFLSTGDLVTLNPSGGLTVQFGQTSGRFEGKKTGTGWPAGTLAVPFADTGSDRCAELLVRIPGGELRQYTGRCGQSGYTPKSSHTTIGKGWQQFDVLTSPGDLNGDGRADLLARQTTTGDMYLFPGAAGGKFAPKVRIYTNWKTYAQITGVGDITGDGRADLLCHDRKGGLWRYNGLGNGRFAPRAQVFSGWGSSYNAMVGVGDLTGDGKNDIVVRDSAGKLFRNNGNGKGSFGPRTQIATGWKAYKGLF